MEVVVRNSSCFTSKHTRKLFERPVYIGYSFDWLEPTLPGRDKEIVFMKGKADTLNIIF